jgi:hypothetical protein
MIDLVGAGGVGEGRGGFALRAWANSEGARTVIANAIPRTVAEKWLTWTILKIAEILNDNLT